MATLRRQKMKVLLTGAAGFLGRGMIETIGAEHTLRLMDVVSLESSHESIVGDVCDLETVRRAVAGMDAIVAGHMAPRGPGVYDVPTLPFDINVKGVAHLYQAAAEAGIKRMVLISSTSVVLADQRAGNFLRRDLPPSTGDIYSLTKSLQETVADHYHRNFGIATAIMRPAYITDEDAMTDKYGRKAKTVNWQFIDRRDIGDAANAALRLPDLGCEVFYVLGHPDALEHADVAYTHQRLGWQPRHDFSKYPRDEA